LSACGELDWATPSVAIPNTAINTLVETMLVLI
jgi:hypothetical protein